MFNYNKVNFSEMEYSAIITIKENFQVVRMMVSIKQMKKNEIPKYFHSEVMQHWINEKGEVTTLGKKTMGMSQAYDQWIYAADFSLPLGLVLITIFRICSIFSLTKPIILLWYLVDLFPLPLD